MASLPGILKKLFIEMDIAAWLALLLLLTVAYDLWALYEAWHMFSIPIPMKSPG